MADFDQMGAPNGIPAPAAPQEMPARIFAVIQAEQHWGQVVTVELLPYGSLWHSGTLLTGTASTQVLHGQPDLCHC